MNGEVMWQFFYSSSIVGKYPSICWLFSYPSNAYGSTPVEEFFRMKPWL
jgi:hypothetical protein